MIRKPFFVVPYDIASLTLDNPAGFISGYPVSNLAKHEYISNQFRTIQNFNIFADLGFARDIDFLGMIGTNAKSTFFSSWFLSNTADFSTIIYNNGRLPFIDPPAQFSYSGFVHNHSEIPLNKARYALLGGEPTDGSIFQASHIVIGKKIEFDHFYDGGYGMGFEGFDAPSLNSGGVPDLQKSAILRTLKFALSTMTKADFHGKFMPLIIALKDHKPVYLCFDPQPDGYRNNNTYFGWLRKPPFATIGQTHPEWHSQELEILSQI